MNVYTSDKKISYELNGLIEKLLKMTGDEIYDRYGFKRDETITTTVKFANGYEMDVKLVICGGDEYPYTEAVLFDLQGNQLICSDPEDEYIGKWQLDYDNNRYIASIMLTKNNNKGRKYHDDSFYCVNNRNFAKCGANSNISRN